MYRLLVLLFFLLSPQTVPAGGFERLFACNTITQLYTIKHHWHHHGRAAADEVFLQQTRRVTPFGGPQCFEAIGLPIKSYTAVKRYYTPADDPKIMFNVAAIYVAKTISDQDIHILILAEIEKPKPPRALLGWDSLLK